MERALEVEDPRGRARGGAFQVQAAFPLDPLGPLDSEAELVPEGGLEDEVEGQAGPALCGCGALWVWSFGRTFFFVGMSFRKLRKQVLSMGWFSFVGRDNMSVLEMPIHPYCGIASSTPRGSAGCDDGIGRMYVCSC